MKRENEIRDTPQDTLRWRYEIRTSPGTVLILAVVLTSLLAVVGVMFVMTAQVNRTATSGISENRYLDSAIETVIAKISQELVLDVPGVAGKEYYDYPGDTDPWLASLEPYDKGTNDYRWRQISDVTGYIERDDNVKQSWEIKDIEVDIIEDHKKIELDDDGDLKEQLADADGDGIADSKWIKLDSITSSKGKPIFAAIRVVDNGGMLNVNTAYKFDPDDPAVTASEIDGTSQMQINLAALARGDDTIDDISDARNPEHKPLSDYQQDVIWKIEDPCSDYLPFDISDELELRNRFFLTTLAKTRLEYIWNSTIGSSTFKRVPYDGKDGYNEDHWWKAITQDANKPDRRHFLTTYNMDRIIDPNGDKMVNINTDSLELIRQAILEGIDESEPGREAAAAQIAVNLIDYRDVDSDVNAFTPPDVGGTYYGFERPCIYISELAHKFVEPDIDISPLPVNLIHRSYAIELHKPYPEDDYPDETQWQLGIEGYSDSPITIDWSGTKHFHVMLFQDPSAKLQDDVQFDPSDEDPNFSASYEITKSFGPGNVVFSAGKIISLQREVGVGTDDWISVDSVEVPFAGGEWLELDGNPHSIQRDITLHKCVRRLWADASEASFPTLGQRNNYPPDPDPDPYMVQAHPANKAFTNVGEIGMLFRKAAYYKDEADKDKTVGYGGNRTEENVRLNLADPNYQNVFKYLTVWPPSYVFDPNEKRIKGRININTAPWYVIAQLPWVSQRKNEPTDYELAQAIVAYRDRDTVRGFESIGELMQVDEMGCYANDSENLETYPDLTPDRARPGSPEYAIDDFEERDIIFHRISDLVTVRSDVFTAYILVRIGPDGPQKRVIAILDRSDVYSPTDKLKIIALHPVPDPR